MYPTVRFEDARLRPDDIDYINPHGTGTPENNKMEYLGISTVFGERAKSIPVSSNKSMVGHTLSAAGTVEAVFTLLTLQHQRVSPSTTKCRIRQSRSMWCPTSRGMPGSHTRFRTHSASAVRTCRWLSAASPPDACERFRFMGDRKLELAEVPSPTATRFLMKFRSGSRRLHSITLTSGAIAAWRSPSARCRWWSAWKPRARLPPPALV